MQTKQELVLRKTPTASTKILDIIPAGESVSVLDTLDRWSKVDYCDQEGWVPTSELTTDKVAKETPKLDTKDIEAHAEEILEDVKEKYGVEITPKEEQDSLNISEADKSEEKSELIEDEPEPVVEKKTRKK